MEFTSLGGGIMVALAAGLWLVYLMPTWFKRREFAVSERTEERRQQALRILQETSPVPAVVRAKAIVSASGEVTDRDQLAEAIKRSRDAQAAREANRRFSNVPGSPTQSAFARRTARRLRRTRAVASLFLLASIVTIVAQVAIMIASGIALGAWAVLGFAAVVGIVSFAALGRLATMARRRAVGVVAAPVARPVRAAIVVDEVEIAHPPVVPWTPVPVPKPMYLSRSLAPPADAAADPMEALRAAALESDHALREAQESPEVTPMPQREQPAASDSRFAHMGIVGEVEIEATNLDEVLRRRRQAV
jgi:ABC-type multidrug transport system fused ATPase/permease subunit